MKMRLALALALAAALIPAQEQKQETAQRREQRSVQQKIFQIKYADIQQLANLLSVFGVGIQKDAAMKVIAVTGPPESVAGVEDAIRRLDVPPPAEKNIELVAYFIRASQQAGEGKPLPADLDPVAKQLRSLFGFQDLKLMEAIVVRTRDGQRAEASGSADVPNFPGRPARIQLRLRPRIQTANGARSIRIDDLAAVAGIPYRVPSNPQTKNTADFHYADTSFNTSIDIREGQKVVVGKSGIGGSNEALILVMTAKVLD